MSDGRRLRFERLDNGARFAFFSWRAVLISFSGAEGDAAYFDAFDRALTLHMERNPEAVWMYALHRVERITAQPSSEMRRRSAELLRRVEPILQGNSMVFDMRGLTGAIVRTFVSGVFLLNRSRVSNHVCDDPVEGAEWLRDLEKPPPGLVENFAAFRDTILHEGEQVLGPSPRR